MSVRDEITKLLDDARDVLHKAGLAVNERNRIEEALQVGKSAVSSIPDDEPVSEPVAVQEPAPVAPQAEVKQSSAPEAPAVTEAQSAPESQGS